MSAARFEVVRTDAKQSWHARYRAANGRIVWTTENYTRRRACLAAIETIAGHVVLFAEIRVGCVSISGRFLDVIDVDERTPPPPPPEIEWPVYERHEGQTWLHDRDTHWRNCFTEDCYEITPTAGQTVQCRFGSAVAP